MGCVVHVGLAAGPVLFLEGAGKFGQEEELGSAGLVAGFGTNG